MGDDEKYETKLQSEKADEKQLNLFSCRGPRAGSSQEQSGTKISALKNHKVHSKCLFRFYMPEFKIRDSLEYYGPALVPRSGSRERRQ